MKHTGQSADGAPAPIARAMMGQAAVERISSPARILSVRGQAAIDCSSSSAGALRGQADIDCCPGSNARTLRAQAATEQLILFAVALLIIMVVLSLAVVWPSFVRSVERQSSDRFWSSAKPFAVREHRMYPNQMVLELYNSEPVTLTIKGIYLDSYLLNFYNHSVPFTWSSASYRCSGACTMVLLPGQTQIISTVNFTSSPANPCVAADGFAEGNYYGMDLAITYHASNAAALENESATFKLVGECAGR